MKDHQNFSNWIKCSLPLCVSVSGELNLEPLTGDAGFRRYFRVNSKPSIIAVSSPPEKEKNPEYVNLSLFLQSQGLITPKIHGINFTHGYMLVEDFGCTLFRQKLETRDPDVLYYQAETELLKIQCATDSSPTIPLHDHNKMGEELALFEQWFLNSLLDYQLNADEKRLLHDFFEVIKNSAKQQPQVIIHADYHSRNLMILDGGKLGVIDFQDAMLGAITYDLVSLLKDCYIRWPASWVAKRVQMYKQRLEKAGLLANIDDKQFSQWFDFMGLQRHIKVLGIFSRLALRDSKDGYLKDIPLVVHYCLEASERYPQAIRFNQWFKVRIMPLLFKQSWYSNFSDTGQ